MYARIASFEGVDVARMREEGERRQREMPETVRGFLVLADSEQGKSRFITFYDSKEDLDATESHWEQMGSDIPEEMRGRRTSVEAFEVAASQIPAMV